MTMYLWLAGLGIKAMETDYCSICRPSTSRPT